MTTFRALYRPVGADELELIIDSGMKCFPPRLYWQPIFYPVLNIEYASEIADRWNMGDKDSNGAGFVTAFEIPETYFLQFQVQIVGMTHHQELWVLAEQLDEFNQNIVHGIRVERAFIGNQFKVNDKIRKILP
jgi:hypothetical protein